MTRTVDCCTLGGIEREQGGNFPFLQHWAGLVSLVFFCFAFSPPISTAGKEPQGFGYLINQAGNGLVGGE